MSTSTLKMFPTVFVLILIAFVSIPTKAQVTEFIRSNYQEQLDAKAKLLTYHPKNDIPSTGALAQTPVVFWHGMGDTAYGSINVDRVALQRKFPNLTVLSIQIGNNVAEDEIGGYFVNVNHQIEMVCKEMLSNDLLKRHGAFNGVGFSQGGQFIRGLIQRCPFRQNGIRPKNIITLGGQHQGVFGLPNCESNAFCEHIRFLLTTAAYSKIVQEHVVQAEYWHDPKKDSEYRNKSVFLADINNENQINATYRDNLLALENLVLVEFLQDEMVVPRESSLFGYYDPEKLDTIQPLESSQLYIEDRLGLRVLNESGRLHQIKRAGGHLRYPMSWFLNTIASKYLAN